MPQQNLVSGTLTDEALANALGNIQTLESALDFLISLSPDDRQRLLKLQTGHLAFVKDMQDVCNQNPDFLPRQFDLDELGRDINLADRLEQVEAALTRLAQRVNDTLLAVKSDMYSSALEAYGYLQVARDGDGLDVHRRELRQYFRRPRRNLPDAEAEASAGAPEAGA